MDQGTVPAPAENILYGALELSKNRWILLLQFPDQQQPSLYPISGWNAKGLMVKPLRAATLGEGEREVAVHHGQVGRAGAAARADERPGPAGNEV